MNSPVIEQLLHSRRTGTPVNVPISDLIRTLSGSCDCGDDESWLLDVFFVKLADYEMGWLIDSVLENGMLLPLNVIRYGAGSFEMGNGHHRLVAALLCGIEHIDVIVTDGVEFHHSSDDSMEMEYDVSEAYEVWHETTREIMAEIGSLILDF